MKQKSKMISKSILLGGIFALCFSFVSIQNVFGVEQSITEIEKTSEAQSKLKELEEKAERYKKMIKIKQEKQNTLSNQISLMETEIEYIENDINAKKGEIEGLTGDIERLENKIKEQERIINAQTKLLGNLAQTYYERKKENILSNFINGGKTFSFLGEEDKLVQTEEKVSEIMNSIKSLKSESEIEKGNLESKRVKVTDLYYELEDKNSQLESSKESKEILILKTKREESEYQKLLKDIQNEIYNVESSKEVDYSNLPPAKGKYFDYPVSIPKVTQSYGCLRDSFARKSYPSCDGGQGGFHNGIDYGKNSGTNIFSVRKGKVIELGDNRGYAYGKWVAIDHEDGLVTLYGHFYSTSVSKGDKVKAGDKIGIMGDTGYSTATHLHFSVFDKKSFEIVESSHIKGLYIPAGASVDPDRYFTGSK